MELCACYKKSGQAKYALVAGSVKIGPRNPTYTISPYPFYVGQKVELKFTGTGLGADDQVKIIAENGICNADSNSLKTVSTPVKKNEDVNDKAVTYTITGSEAGCFTVCYQHNQIWTISTNTG
eukprot:Tbor_TRINITY_DN6121_c1_g2::TRINITY_DN6121_c1_g2_i25::g.22070::m.22070